MSIVQAPGKECCCHRNPVTSFHFQFMLPEMRITQQSAALINIEYIFPLKITEEEKCLKKQPTIHTVIKKRRLKTALTSVCNQLSPALSHNITESNTVQTLWFSPKAHTNPHEHCLDCSFLPLYLPPLHRPWAVNFFSPSVFLLKKQNIFSSALQSCVTLLFCFPLFCSEPKMHRRAETEESGAAHTLHCSAG